MAHSHGSAAAKHRGRLVAVFLLTLAVLVVEAIGGIA
jgi:Co/Zn/Cd efflux system component